MKKELGKWLMDIAKYITTAVVGLFLFFEGSTNGLRFLASRFHLLRCRFVVQPFGQSRNTARVQTDNMIFFFLKAADRIVAVYQLHGISEGKR